MTSSQNSGEEANSSACFKLVRSVGIISTGKQNLGITSMRVRTTQQWMGAGIAREGSTVFKPFCLLFSLNVIMPQKQRFEPQESICKFTKISDCDIVHKPVTKTQEQGTQTHILCSKCGAFSMAWHIGQSTATEVQRQMSLWDQNVGTFGRCMFGSTWGKMAL